MDGANQGTGQRDNLAMKYCHHQQHRHHDDGDADAVDGEEGGG